MVEATSESTSSMALVAHSDPSNLAVTANELCPLVKMPSEIHIMIFELLDDKDSCDVICLALASKKFWTLLPTFYKPKIALDSHLGLANRLEKWMGPQYRLKYLITAHLRFHRSSEISRAPGRVFLNRNIFGDELGGRKEEELDAKWMDYEVFGPAVAPWPHGMGEGEKWYYEAAQKLKKTWGAMEPLAAQGLMEKADGTRIREGWTQRYCSWKYHQYFKSEESALGKWMRIKYAATHDKNATTNMLLDQWQLVMDANWDGF